MLGINVVVAILVAGLIVAGWFIANQYQDLKSAEAELVKADGRLKRLEERLRMTDEVMSASDDEMQDQLGFWEDEIRKLWDITNKRNKNWINTNQGKLKKHDASLASIGESVKALKSSVSRHDEAFGQQAAVLDQLAAIDLQVRQLVNKNRELTDQVNAARQSVAGVESGLARRVNQNAESIEAIDAHRRQLNARLVELGSRIDSLYGSPTP
jgi:chromosome segregation ATPase